MPKSVPHSPHNAATEAAGSQNQGTSERSEASAPAGQPGPHKAGGKKNGLGTYCRCSGLVWLQGRLMMTLQALALILWRARSSDTGLFG